MAKKTEIEMEIGPDGEVKFHVKGVKGKGCLQYEELLRQLLGPVKDRQLTSEYYEQEVRLSGEIQGKVRR